MTRWVRVGRVGRPHGRDGSFVVEEASEEPLRFELGARVYLDREPATVAASKRAGGRVVIRLDRDVERGATLELPETELPEPEEGAWYTFQLLGLDVEEEGGRAARKGCRRGAGNRERRAGALERRLAPRRRCLHQVGRSRRRADRRRAGVRVARLALSARRSLLKLDVFTLLPHAFSWLTEARPIASVLGRELELRLWNYRDFTPLPGGRVDDEPYGGGAGMIAPGGRRLGRARVRLR